MAKKAIVGEAVEETAVSSQSTIQDALALMEQAAAALRAVTGEHAAACGFVAGRVDARRQQLAALGGDDGK